MILDNLNTHQPEHDRWLARHPQVQSHYTPTHASWLNQTEIWFSLLARQALKRRSFTSPQALRQAISDFAKAYNGGAAPFEWRKAVVRQVQLAHCHADLRK